MEQRFVPKFSSFKPKRTDEDIPSREKRAQRHEDRELAELKQKQDEEERRRHRNFPGHCDEYLPTKRHGTPQKTQNQDALLPPQHSDLFTVDRMGDQDNAKYGRNKSSSVPRYWEPRKRIILGDDRGRSYEASPSRNLLRNLTNEEMENLQTNRENFVFQNSDLGHSLSNSQTSTHAEADFLSFRSSKRRKLSSATQPLGVERSSTQVDEDESQKIETAIPTNSSGEATSEESETEVEGDGGFQTLKMERINLASRTKSEPGNAQNWLDFIAFQDKWIAKSRIHQEDYEISDTRPIAEVKVSIYKDALGSAGLTARDRERLLIGFLAEAEKVYTADKLGALWKDTIQKNKGYHDLFLKYLEYVQSNATGFVYDRCSDLYLDHLKRLDESAAKASDEAQRGQIYRQQVYAMLRITNYLHDCGYQELALAIWQALLEINCMGATMSSESDLCNENNQDFERFWDSEKPRIGEELARGWKQELGKTIDLSSLPVLNQSMTSASGFENSIEKWFRNESREMAKLQMPVRSTEEQDYNRDDPFRVVFFADIERFLIANQDPVFAELLVQGFLCFVHMPPLPMEPLRSDSSDWWNDGLIVSPTRSFQHYLSTNTSLFDTIESCFAKSERKLIPMPFVARVLSALLTSPTLSASTKFHLNLAEYHIAHLVHSFPDLPKLAPKAAQSLLKARPSSLRLYNAYALAVARNNEPKSSQVFATAIGSASSLDIKEQTNISLLYENWARLAISSQDRQAALERLATYPDNRPVVTQSLDENLDRVHQRLLNEIFKASIDTSTVMEAGYALDILASLVYARTSFSLQAALDIFSDHLTRLHDLVSSPSHNHIIEAIHEARARLVRHHTSTTPNISPRTIRDALEESACMFPANPLIRGVWRDNERRFLFDEHVRRLAKQAHLRGVSLSEEPKMENSALSTLHDIEDATSRLILPPSGPSTSTLSSSPNIHDVVQDPNSRPEPKPFESNTASINTALALFTRTLQDPKYRRFPVIWIRYLTFLSQIVHQSRPSEVTSSQHNKNKERPLNKLHESLKFRLRDVFYAAFNAVPSSKRVALFAFNSDYEVAGLLSEDEQREVLETMEERGLRFMAAPPI